VVESAIIPGAYFGGKMPVAAIEFGVPFTIQTMLQLDYLFWEYGFIDILRKAYAEHGVYYVAPLCGVGNALMTKVPVYNVDDLKKLKVRTPGMVAETLKEVGVSVVYIPGEELYTSMATGVVDACTWGAAVGQTQMKTYEIAKYFVKKPMLSNIVVEAFMVNMKQWQKLPDDLKAVLETACRQVSARRMRIYEVQELTLLKKMVDEHGVKVIEWKDADIVPLQKAAMKVLDRYAEKETKYAKPAAKLMKDFLKEIGIFKD
jgi:TRAP-type mannitol/chloroaromatic compound transport system substrate-binding protein